LDRMLAAIGRARTAETPEAGAYITNVVPYRPLENRTPSDQEVALLLPFALRHVELARPKAILCLGNVSAKHLMAATTGITRFRGEWRDLRAGTHAAPALASFHPAYLLRSPEQKRLAWRDLLELEARLAAD
ncbi:MAG: uracil-DNA glycosylase, partial [Pseudomonadota bacterium]